LARCRSIGSEAVRFRTAFISDFANNIILRLERVTPCSSWYGVVCVFSLIADQFVLANGRRASDIKYSTMSRSPLSSLHWEKYSDLGTPMCFNRNSARDRGSWCSVWCSAHRLIVSPYARLRPLTFCYATAQMWGGKSLPRREWNIPPDDLEGFRTAGPWELKCELSSFRRVSISRRSRVPQETVDIVGDGVGDFDRIGTRYLVKGLWCFWRFVNIGMGQRILIDGSEFQELFTSPSCPTPIVSGFLLPFVSSLLQTIGQLRAIYPSRDWKPGRWKKLYRDSQIHNVERSGNSGPNSFKSG
jgi:hypothetical protein